MDLEHSFIIPVPPEQAWQALLDVEQGAPCMPGATVDGFDGENISGKIKIKVGPVQMTYAGKARFTEKDEATKTVVVEASGKKTRRRLRRPPPPPPPTGGLPSPPPRPSCRSRS